MRCITMVACILPLASPVLPLSVSSVYSCPSGPATHPSSSLTHLTPLFISDEPESHRPRAASTWCSATVHSEFRGSNGHARCACLSVCHECDEQGANPFQGSVWATSARPVLWWYATRIWLQALGLQRVQSRNSSINVVTRWGDVECGHCFGKPGKI